MQSPAIYLGSNKNLETRKPWRFASNRPIKKFPGIALLLFAAGATLLSGEGQQRLLGIIFGACTVLAFLNSSTQTQKKVFHPPLDFLLYSLWYVWCLIGVGYAVNPSAGVQLYITLAQVWVAGFLLYTLAVIDFRYISFFLIGLVLGVLIQFLNGVLNPGNFFDFTDRYVGLARNPNGLGMNAVRALIALFLVLSLSKVSKSKKRVVVIVGLLVVGIIVLQTASRKSLFALVFFLSLYWLLTKTNHGFFSKVLFLIPLSAGIFLVAPTVLPDFLNSTLAGQRIVAFVERGGGSVTASLQQDIRFLMYTEGFKIFLSNPVFGVGLGNFNHHFFTGQYSHSDYMEPLATTGTIGFLLYHSLNIGTASRTLMALQEVRDRVLRNRILLCGVGLLTLFLLGLGAPFHTSHINLMLVLSFWFVVRQSVGESRSLKNSFCRRRIRKSSVVPRQ